MTSFHLLAVGADPSVLATRADVLKRAGYQVTTGSSEEAAQRLLGTGTFNVIVICHSFAPAQRARVVKAARAANPVPKIVVINRSPEPEAGADANIHSLDGPDRLLECIAELLSSFA